ncbi:MAG: hypothetical protein IJH21_02705 [Oscillospiraceae bacterium]|nr:hypothetical protein [Oscillospiraceae bacterium]
MRKGGEKTQTGGCGSGQEENTENDQEKSDFSELRPDRFGDGLLLREGKFLRVLRIMRILTAPLFIPVAAGALKIK